MFSITQIPHKLILNQSSKFHVALTLKVLVATTDAQREGMGDVGSTRYEPALLPPCPTMFSITQIPHKLILNQSSKFHVALTLKVLVATTDAQREGPLHFHGGISVVTVA